MAFELAEPKKDTPELAELRSECAKLGSRVVRSTNGPKAVAFIAAIAAGDWKKAKELVAGVVQECDAQEQLVPLTTPTNHEYLAPLSALPKKSDSVDSAGRSYGADTGVKP